MCTRTDRRPWARLAGLLLTLVVVAAPAESHAQTPPAPAETPSSTPRLPALTLDDLPAGFMALPKFAERYAGSYCGSSSCARGEFVRGLDYVASTVRRSESAQDTWEEFPDTLPMPTYSPRWLDPPMLGDEARLMAISEPILGGHLPGFDLAWRRGEYLSHVITVGEPNDAEFVVTLARILDQQLISIEPGPDTPVPDTQVDDIARQVRDVRELAWRGRVAFSLRAPATLSVYPATIALPAPWPPDPTNAGLLKDSATPAIFDLPVEFQYGLLRLLGQASQPGRWTPQAAGMYSPENEVRVMSSGWPLGWREQIVLAHEFDHALQDQHFGLSTLTDDLLHAFPARNSDAAWALSALVDGEADFTARQWADRHLETGSFDTLRSDQQQRDSDAGVPALLEAQIRYPYWEGERFAASAYDQGGWPAVNSLFSRAPVSSRQVLHPDAYWAELTPTTVDAPNTAALAARGWAPLLEDTFGEIGLRAILEPFIGSQQATACVAGWSGDRYVVVGTPTFATDAYFLSGMSDLDTYGRPELVALDTQWDDRSAAQRFYAGLVDALDTRFERSARWTDRDGSLNWSVPRYEATARVAGDRVRFIVGPDRAAVAAVAAGQE
ncbi:MAG TPA: hypothetical protein VF937_17375 [Chloroflexota bacterium]